MSESTAKAQLDQEGGEGATGYITPSDIQDAIGIIYDDFEAGDALRLSLGGGTLSGSLAGTSLSLSSTLAVTGNTTLTGDLTISKASASQTISSSAGQTSFNLDRIAGQYGIIQLRTGTSARWQMGIDSASESGSNAGSDFGLWAIDDNGSTTVTRALSITRSTGAVTLTGTLNGKVVNDLVTGPVSATDNALVRFDGTGGKTVQNSGITVDDSGSFTTDITVDKSAPRVVLTSAAGSGRYVRYRTAGVDRWLIGTNSTAEGGANAGSDLSLLSYTDAGSLLRTDLVVTRSTGRWTFGSVGATAGLELGASGPRIMSGTGSPESVVTAPVGSIWFQTDSTVGVTHWRKATGTGNTGWVVMEGDTGWRNVAADINTDWTLATTLGALQIRRVGNRVSLMGRIKRVTASGTRAASSTVYTAPAGFRNEFYTSVGNAYNVTAAMHGMVYSNSDITNLEVSFPSGNYGANETVHFHVSYPVTSAWPTSLPGTAA